MPEASGSSRPSSSESVSAAKRPRRDSLASCSSLDPMYIKDALVSFAEARDTSRNARKKEQEKSGIPRHVVAYGQGFLDKLSLFKGRKFLEVTKKIDDMLHFEIMSNDCEDAVNSHFI